jgi:pimeloyl-ACP methyl ester carboxylesterase
MEADEINVLGFSQGALIARYIVEECSDLMKPKVRNLVSVGAPNMGEAGIPKCPDSHDIYKLFSNPMTYLASPICHIANTVAKALVYLPYVQRMLSPSDFYRYPDDLMTYYKHSSFLPYLNNEVNHTDFDRYRKNIQNLNTFALVQWDADMVLYPRETSMFD